MGQGPFNIDALDDNLNGNLILFSSKKEAKDSDDTRDLQRN